jgi:hypothetical protein
MFRIIRECNRTTFISRCLINSGVDKGVKAGVENGLARCCGLPKYFITKAIRGGHYKGGSAFWIPALHPTALSPINIPLGPSLVITPN